MDRIINNIQFDTKFYIHVKNIKNMQSTSYNFKICRQVNFFSGSCSYWLQLSL